MKQALVLAAALASLGASSAAQAGEFKNVNTSYATAATLTVTKRIIPLTDPGKFNLQIDGVDRALNVGTGGTTGLIAVSPGNHLVREGPANNATNLCNYVATYSGGCDATGHVFLNPGQHKSCTITNRRRTWVPKAPMPTARQYFGVGVINNKIYAVGGQGGWYSTLEMYNPATNIWSTKAPMPTARTGVATGVVNGILYAVGGNKPNGAGGASVLSTIEAYNPATNTWTTKAPMPTPRDGLAIGVINGKLYAVGGNASVFGWAMNKVEAYNPVTNTWTTKAPLPAGRAWHGVAVFSNRLYAIGGRSGPNSSGPLATVQTYNPATNSWATAPSMPSARWGIGATMVNGKIYAVGFGAGNAVHNPANGGTWFNGVPLLTGRNFLGVAVVNNVIYAIGGNNSLGVTGKVEAFGPC